MTSPRTKSDCHRAAVGRTLSWADEAASGGDYGDALAWLGVLDAIGEDLPAEYGSKRLAWRLALVETGVQG